MTELDLEYRGVHTLILSLWVTLPYLGMCYMQTAYQGKNYLEILMRHLLIETTDGTFQLGVNELGGAITMVAT